MHTGSPVRGRRPSAAFSFLMAGLFALLSLWSGAGDPAYTAALLLVAALWTAQGTVTARRSRD
ncbi:hypothetical protein [Streptomyces sp. ODS28]|uniref:hypothetical protein n=1 Tax=Streptomyces sp. ODS28 TaxID=3136688 RepID=UPI0031EEE57A